MSGATKVIDADTDTGQTVYAVVRQMSTGYLLKTSDGTFAAGLTSAQASNALTEDSVIKGHYSLSESRTVWGDDKYEICIYSQTGGSPATASDFPLGNGVMYIRTDIEVNSLTLNAMILAITGSILSIKKRVLTANDDIIKAVNIGFAALRSAIQDIKTAILRGGT